MKKLLLIIILFIPGIAYSLSASSAILMDTDNKRIIYSKNIHKVSSVASISKIMTAILAIESKKYNKEIIVGKEVLKAHGSGIYIKEKEKLKVKDLVYGLMLRSGNDAAIVIAFKVAGSKENFVDLMNQKAEEIGMSNTVFNNPSGLDDEEEGNYSSCYDMALLMSYAMQNKEFRKVTSTKTYNLKTNKNVYKWVNKNKLLHQYKYATGGKTGFTKKARRTLVTTASKNKLNLVAVTFNDGNDFKDHQDLFEQSFKEYRNYQILKKGNINIIDENYYKYYKLYIKKDFFYPITNIEKETFTLNFKINKQRKYKNGSKVGKVYVFMGDKKIHVQNIYVKRSIDDK